MQTKAAAAGVSTDTIMERDAATECKTHCGVEIKVDIQATYQVEVADVLSTHRLSSWHLCTGQVSSMILSANSRTAMDGIFEHLLSTLRTSHTNLTHRPKLSGNSSFPAKPVASPQSSLAESCGLCGPLSV